MYNAQDQNIWTLKYNGVNETLQSAHSLHLTYAGLDLRYERSRCTVVRQWMSKMFIVGIVFDSHWFKYEYTIIYDHESTSEFSICSMNAREC